MHVDMHVDIHAPRGAKFAFKLIIEDFQCGILTRLLNPTSW